MKFGLGLVGGLLVSLLGLAFVATPARADDWRAYHHGIAAVPDGEGKYWLFYSAVVDPSREVGDEEEWTHSIYVAKWQMGQSRIASRLFVHKRGAQEPVSAARSEDGHIMISAEDSYRSEEGVAQRFGLYAHDLSPLKPYPQEIEEGGHSGHVAAVGNRFVAFYSDGWIDGGGVDDLGSGYGVYAKIYDSAGRLERAVDVATDKREWWPMIAGGPTRALLVWQAFVRGEDFARLRLALLDPATGAVHSVPAPWLDLAYYTYAVRYMPAIRRFIVTAGSEEGPSVAFLLDEDGHMTAFLSCLPPTVREAGIAIAGEAGEDALIPVGDNKMMRLHATPYGLALAGYALAPFNWAEEGSLGLPNGRDRVHWVSLGRYGLLEADFSLRDFVHAAGKDQPSACH